VLGVEGQAAASQPRRRMPRPTRSRSSARQRSRGVRGGWAAALWRLEALPWPTAGTFLMPSPMLPNPRHDVAMNAARASAAGPVRLVRQARTQRPRKPLRFLVRSWTRFPTTRRCQRRSSLHRCRSQRCRAGWRRSSCWRRRCKSNTRKLPRMENFLSTAREGRSRSNTPRACWVKGCRLTLVLFLLNQIPANLGD
jgi:hypothetical protein